MSGIKKPILIVNLKVYDRAIENPMQFADIALRVAQETGVNIVIAPSHLALASVAKVAPAFAQSVDSFEPGPYTGSVIAEELKKYGAIGAIINHSERRMKSEHIAKAVEQCRQHGLVSVVCVETPKEAELYATYSPDFIAIEPPELIGKYSVTEVNPKIVSDCVNTVKAANRSVGVLCGAGIKTTGDVRKAVELGVDGVLVASSIVKAADVEKSMTELAGGFNSSVSSRNS